MHTQGVGIELVSGHWSGEDGPDPGSRNSFCVDHADLDTHGADTTITCVANMQDPMLNM